MARYQSINVRKFLVSLLVVFLVSPALVLAHGQGGGKKLKLEVSDDGQSLVPKTRSDCKGHRSRPDMDEDGCFRFEKGKWDVVRIELKREPCYVGPRSFEWELDRVQLAGVNSAEKPEWGGKIDDVAARDFNADPATGEIRMIDGAPGRSISFVNRNDSINGYTVWYRVRATCDGMNPIYFDPRYDNEGNP